MRTIPNSTIKIHLCHGHISGLLGESFLKFFFKEKLIEKLDGAFKITEKGWDELELIGMDVNELRFINHNSVTICIERKKGILYEHIGSSLGSLLLERLIELCWIKRIGKNQMVLTTEGVSGLESFGIKVDVPINGDIFK